MRTRKRPLIEEDEGEETFINNSDYEESGKGEETNGGEGLERDVFEEEVNQDEEVNEDEERDEQEEEEDEEEVVTGKPVNPRRTHTPTPIAESNNGNVTPSNASDIATNRITSTSSTTSTSTTTTTTTLPPLSNGLGVPVEKLSFLHQQSDIQLQSPTKRRELQQQQLPPATRENEPRLVIDLLVLTNFKSYAGKQIIGPFNASFLAVVGPNGSGKSNVIDSMLFVFGFRALKMRQGKLSELIHNSEGGQKLDYCQVDIHFHNVMDEEEGSQGEKSSTKVPNSELIISRKAFRNNSSQYYINGKSSSYTEVTDFLKGKGIDLDHKRFLILQGEVESIAQMKAKAERENDDGLLEYLEDIIGTAKYKQLIESNLLKIDELNDVCLEKETRFELVEKDKDLLEDKKIEALRFLEMEKKLINKQSIQFQANILEGGEKLTQIMSKKSILDEELSKEKEANKELNKEIELFRVKQEEIKQFLDSLKEQERQLIKQQKQVGKASVSIEEKVKNLTNRAKKAEKLIQSLEMTINSSTIKLQSNSEISNQYKIELEELVSNLDIEKRKLEEIRRNLTTKTSGFSKEIEILQKKLEPWMDKLKVNEGSITLINSLIQMLQTQRESVEKQLNEGRQKLMNIKVDGKKKEQELLESKEKLNVVIEQIQLMDEKLKLQREELSKKKSNLSNIRQRTQDSVNSFSKNQNRNNVLTSLMRLAKSGRIDGFYGRLGDLGSIDDRYDIAISTAAPGLDSMVVETVETAQSCIDYLRKNKLGYANFICLNKLRKFDLRPISTPGNPASVKRLFDLIQPSNDKFLPAFYSKMFNTLVASNLGEAKQVAYGAKRWKVVTLDGKVVDTSGTMSGGGNYVARGAMKLSSQRSNNSDNLSEEEVEKMRIELNQLESQFELLSREYQENENELRSLKEQKPELEFTISRLQLDIEALIAEKKETLIACKALIAESENDTTNQEINLQIQAKELEKGKLIKEGEELKAQMVDSELQIKQLEEKILQAGGVELRLQNSKVDSNKQKIEILNEKISNDRLSVRKLENEIKRHTKILGESQDSLHEAEKDLEESKALQERKKEELEKLNKSLQEIESVKEDKQTELDDLNVQMEEKNQQINEFKSKEIELEEKIEKYAHIIKKTKRDIEELEESLSGLIVRDVEPYIEWLDNDEEKRKYDGGEIEKLSKEEIDHIDMDTVNKEIEELETYMNNVKVDIEVLKEYGSKKVEFESRRNDLNHAVSERDGIKGYCEELKRKRLDEFMEGFNTISMSLKEMYQMITMGGNAELELVDSLDPFSEGILFSVMPPKKSWKNISNLSGGEKTLSSLALVFALHRYKPTPLYVMDEIDAALDFRNVSIVANYIKERTKNAQFVVISLRNNMFELAQQLVGIYKVNNMTRSISLQNKDFLADDE